jgi:hypothetical protein
MLKGALYWFYLLTHSMMIGTGVLNLKQADNTEPTFQNYFILNSMIYSSILHFVSDLYHLLANFTKRNIQYIVHHVVFLSAIICTLLTNNIHFIRNTMSISMLTEISGVVLDIDALYKVYLNPESDPREYSENKTVASKIIKIIFLSTFVVVRYIIAPFLVFKYYMKTTLNSYEKKVFFSTMSLYSLMHAFWFYKICGYVAKYIKIERSANMPSQDTIQN